MAALGIELTNRDPDLFTWATIDRCTHSKPASYVAAQELSEKAWGYVNALADLDPIPYKELEQAEEMAIKADALVSIEWTARVSGKQNSNNGGLQ